MSKERWAGTCTAFLDALKATEAARPHPKDCELRHALKQQALMEQAEQLATTIRSLSETPEQWAQLLQQLKGSDEVLKRSISVRPEMLNTLDAAQHTIGWLFILDKIGEEALNVPELGEVFFMRTVHLISQCLPEQLHVAPDKFASVCRRLREFCVATGHTERAIPPLRMAIRKVQPTPEHLTPQHVDYLQACLLAKLYTAAMDVLKEDVFEAEPSKTGLTSRDFLLYCYYGGMAYVGLKRWPKALEFFLHAITAPAATLNAIAVASYKKHLLVSLIHTGTVAGFPKYTSSAVQRHVKGCAAEYQEVATAYVARDIEVLRACLATHAEAYAKDNNLGLVKQCVASFYKRAIQRLTQTYLTLSLDDIAVAVGLPSAREAEMHILKMIDAGEIFAKINQKDSMVSFLEDPEQYNSSAMLERLDAEVKNMALLAKKVAAVDEQVATSRAYISKMMQKGRLHDQDDFEIGTSMERMF